MVRGVGRIQQSAQTRDSQEYRRRDGVLSKLIEGGHLEVLRAFKAGALTMRELLDADRDGHLATVLRDRVLDVPLKEAVEAWLPDSAREEASRRRYATSANRLLKRLPDRITVRQLPGVNWRRLRREWGASDADWNRARAMLSAFLSCHLGGKFHPHRLAVMSACPRGKESPGVLPDATPDDLWRAVAAAPDYTRPAYVAMATLGVGPKEYQGIRRVDLSPDQLTVTVNGTKAPQRRRVVAVDGRLWEWVERAVPAPLGTVWLRRHWKEACEAAGVRLRLYDLRHLSAQYAADGGATDRDLTVHLGHSNPAMSHRYARRAVARGVAHAIGDALLGPAPKSPDAHDSAQTGAA
jgi:integrase